MIGIWRYASSLLERYPEQRDSSFGPKWNLGTRAECPDARRNCWRQPDSVNLIRNHEGSPGPSDRQVGP
jgi:hypothetical protein